MDHDRCASAPLAEQRNDVSDDALLDARVVMSFVGGVLAMLVSGTLYSYSAFSDALETQLDISVADSGWIVKVGNIGLCIAIPAGIAADRIGLRFCAVVGAILCSVGYGLMWARLEGYIDGGVVPMSMFYFLAGQGCQFTYMPGLMNFKNLPSRFHGVSLGILDMSFGLSSVLFSQIYAQTFGRNTDPSQQNLSGFMLFIAISMLCVNTLNLFLVHVRPNRADAALPESRHEQARNTSRKDAPLQELLRSADFWLLFIFFLINQGTTVWFIGSVNDMANAFDLPSGPTLVSLLTAAGAVCRITSGVWSDILRNFASRPTVLFVTSLLLPLGFALLVVSPRACLTAGALLIAAAFGCSWCLVPLVISDTFGAKAFSTNWGIVILASAIGPLLLQPVDTAVQHAHGHKRADAWHCAGEGCYRDTYMVCLVLSIIASCLVVALVYSKRHKSRPIVEGMSLSCSP